MKVDPGFYDIDITVGDSEIMARYDLQVNKKEAVARFLKANDFLTVGLKKVNALHGKITLTSRCPIEESIDQNFCKYSWTRISSLQIIQVFEVDEDPDDRNIKEETKHLGCGEAYEGGRCNADSNVQDCIFDDLEDPHINSCTGTLALYRISNSYMCEGQRGKVKCTKGFFED